MQPAPGTFLEVSVADALKVAEGRTILDVREVVEWNEGHVPSALLVPLADIPTTIETVVPDKATPLLVHCAVGARSRRASQYLAENGYTNVLNIQGRMAEWKALGGAWEVPAQLLTEADRARYSRQILIPEIGLAGPAPHDPLRLYIISENSRGELGGFSTGLGVGIERDSNGTSALLELSSYTFRGDACAILFLREDATRPDVEWLRRVGIDWDTAALVHPRAWMVVCRLSPSEAL